MKILININTRIFNYNMNTEEPRLPANTNLGTLNWKAEKIICSRKTSPLMMKGGIEFLKFHITLRRNLGKINYKLSFSTQTSGPS